MFSDHSDDGLRIEPMRREHMRRVLAIEHESFSSPWSGENFLRLLESHCVGMVAEFKWPRWSKVPHVVGFTMCDMRKDHLHLLNLAVDRDWRRCGVGTYLIQTLAESFDDGGRRQQIVLEVREANVTAQLFFRQVGFRVVAVLREFFTDVDEAAYRMTRPLARLEAADQQRSLALASNPEGRKP